MAIVLRFAPQGMTTAKYDEVTRKLEQAGAGSPPGRLYHVCFGDPNNLRVSDIWDSRESFDKFSQTLRPILEEAGVTGGEPEELPVHNIVEGAKAATTTPQPESQFTGLPLVIRERQLPPRAASSFAGVFRHPDQAVQ